MMTEAITPNNELDMKVEHLPLADIFSDPEFNIRGETDTASVVDLSRDIEQHGLLQPITVQPYNHPPYKYIIVVGHRRYAAYDFLQRTTIPAIVKTGLTPIDSLTLNFVENIQRKNLNILEEAKGIDKFVRLGANFQEIGKYTGQGRNWVLIRYALLSMPEEVQKDAAAGFLTQANIRDLSNIKDPKEQMSIVKSIKEARLKGEQRLPQVTKKKRKPTDRVRRTPEEIFSMIEHIIETMGSGNIATLALAWANGEISDLDFYRELEKFAKANGFKYSPPPEIRELIVKAQLT